MKINLELLWLCFLILSCYSSCQRELSFETGQQSAGHLLAGNDGGCLPLSLAGQFVAGQAANETNFVDVVVYVTTPGAYVVSTPIVNGYLFDATGTFSDTGMINIRLMGEGTPIQAGRDQFTITYNGSTCSFEVTVDDTLPEAAQFTVASIGDSCMINLPIDPVIRGSSLDTTTKVVIQVNVEIPGTYSVHTDMVNGYRYLSAGVFPSPGLQSLTLVAEGVPTQVGENTFTIDAGGTQCTFVVQTLEATPVTGTDYFPLTINSYWVYQDGPDADDTLRRQINGNEELGSQTYSVMEEHTAFQSGKFNHYRKSGRNYFEYSIVEKHTTSLSFFPAVLDEINFLQEDLSQGMKWASAEFQGKISGGQDIQLQYHYECIDENGTATINGVAFVDVYKIVMEPQIRSLTHAYSKTGERFTYFFAKGVGLIYLKKDNNGFKETEWLIKRWTVY